MDDSELLHCYAAHRSEVAFAELVNRHVDLVYSAALRQVGGDVHRAREITQAVFTDVAVKAAQLKRHPFFVGWLHKSAHFAAAKLIRAESRRRIREEKVQIMQEALVDSVPEIGWERIGDWEWVRVRID